MLLKLTLMLILFAQNSSVKKIQFQILPNSQLRISGTSNVTDFTCICEEYFPKLVAEIQYEEKKVRFNNTSLRIATRKLQCGNKLMNEDMYEALKADEYSDIVIELYEVTPIFEQHLTNEWLTMKASACFTIAGVNKEETFWLKALRESANQYRFFGRKALCLNDYHIKMPRPMMGLIKIDNNITLHLDLKINQL
ncbi:MAG: hypothetical protein HC912_01835 [Saprospiraceae bacterium]|nr:hypothetical protein [Saprospiraceae bacterium]